MQTRTEKKKAKRFGNRPGRTRTVRSRVGPKTEVSARVKIGDRGISERVRVMGGATSLGMLRVL